MLILIFLSQIVPCSSAEIAFAHIHSSDSTRYLYFCFLHPLQYIFTTFRSSSVPLHFSTFQSIMHAPAFVLCAAAASRGLLARPSCLGRPLSLRVAPSRRVIRACLPSETQSSAPADPDTLASATPVEEPEASNLDPVVDDSVVDAPVDALVEQTEANAAEPTVSDPATIDEGAADDSDAEPQRRRRRRSRPRREVTLPLDQLSVGMELEGTVKSITDYGAFIGDMGTPTDGLLHVSQLAAGYVDNVTDIVQVGQKVTVRILSVDMEKGNFSLTMNTPEQMAATNQERSGRRETSSGGGKREAQNKKWDDFKFDPEVFIDAKVLSIIDYGAFCQLLNEDGSPLESSPTDGLVHISELSEERVKVVSDILSVGRQVKVRVLSTDRKRNRMSLSLKKYNPKQGDGENTNFAADIASALENQPTLKTSFELAFERARAAK